MISKKTTMTSQPALFSVIVILFFIWGFITLLNDLLIPVLRSKLQLTYAQAMLVQFWFFFAYFLMSLPMTWILNKLDYKKSIIFGLFIIALGCLIFIPAEQMLIYGLFLFALSVLATGIVMLQVSANPIATLLGDTKTSAARLTLAQGINSLGYVLAPILVSSLITSAPLYLIYLMIAAIMIAVAFIIARSNFSVIDAHDTPIAAPVDTHHDANFSLWKDTAFILGVIGIFVYVGAEVSAGSLVVNFLHLSNIAHLTIAEASKYLSIYWGGAMIGRLLGAYVLTRVTSFKLLSFNAIANLLLLFLLVCTSGYLAMWSLLLLGLFNSIMFPTIFALAISNLPSAHLKNKASGFLIMAIVGGAVIPELQGILADHFGLQQSFTLLIICYAVILYCATRMGRYKNQQALTIG